MHPIAWAVCFCWMACYFTQITALIVMAVVAYWTVRLTRSIWDI